MWNWLKSSIAASVHEETEETEQDGGFADDVLLLTEIVPDDE